MSSKSSKLKSIHEDAARKAQRWTFREQFLDTDRLRHINYGNLTLRREAHLFLTHGVVVSVLALMLFWLVSANWNRLLGFTGMFGSHDPAPVQCYEIVTHVTQLPPPPPIAPPEPQPVRQAAAPAEAPKVGKIKKVAEAPAEQTFATQKEIKQAIQQGSGSENGTAGGSGTCDTVVEFVNCQNPPTVVSIPALRYPEMARIAGIEGKVFVRVLIGEDGRAMKANVVKRSPSDCTMFDKEAVRIAMETKYTAGVQNGRKVRVWMTIPVRFTLRES